jgi:hypothetical protein
MEMLDGHDIMVDSSPTPRISHYDRVDLSIEPLDMSHAPARIIRDTDDTPLTPIGPELTEMICMDIPERHKSLYDTLDRYCISSRYSDE